MSLFRGLVLPTLLFAFATWAVWLGGLSAVQNICADGSTGTSGADIATQALQGANTDNLSNVFGFSPGPLVCNNVYRWYWFITAFEFVIIAGALVAAVTPHRLGTAMHFTRPFWIGMFSIATLLFMVASEAFLAGISVPGHNGGTALNRWRTAAAGAIMTVVANIAVLYAIGTHWEESDTVVGKTRAHDTTGAAAV